MRRSHRSVNAGWPEAAMAGALGLRLAGPRRYGGELVEDAWMGDGSAAAPQPTSAARSAAGPRAVGSRLRSWSLLALSVA